MHRLLRSTNRIALIALALLATSVALPADDEDIPRRLENGESRFYENSVETSLAPGGFASAEIERGLRALDPRVGIEIFVEIPVQRRAFTESGRLAIYNILRSPSTMEGIEYYSASRGRMRTFYHESYAVADEDGEEAIPDPHVDSIPSSDVIWAYQRDGSFGQNVQRLEFTARDGSFLMLMENETTMVYTVIPLVRPGNLRTYLYVRPVEDRSVLQFYGNLAVRVPTILGLQERARNSFYNRIVALHDWFIGELSKQGLADDEISFRSSYASHASFVHLNGFERTIDAENGRYTPHDPPLRDVPGHPQNGYARRGSAAEVVYRALAVR
jgi:hypothetical protein